MRIYLDTSALLKRVFEEDESAALTAQLDAYREDSMVSSSLAWVEVSRAIRHVAQMDASLDIDASVEEALAGILEQPIRPEVVALARRIDPPVLRSLDALHLASALLLDADVVVAYDVRLIEAAQQQRIRVLSPGR